MRRPETQSGRFAIIHLGLALGIAAAPHPTAQDPVTSHTTPDGSRFLLLPTGGPPVVHWLHLTPAGAAEDPLGFRGLAEAAATAALRGSDRIGGIDPARERTLLAVVESLEEQLALLRMQGAPPSALADLGARLRESRAAARQAADPDEWSRRLRSAPADMRLEILPDATLLRVTTTTSGIPEVAALLYERRERAVLRGVFEDFEKIRERAAVERSATRLAPLREEALSVAFAGLPLGLALTPGAPPALTREVALATWHRTQRPGRGLHVLVGGFAAAEVLSVLDGIFRATAIGGSEVAGRRNLPGNASVRRSIVPGGESAAVVFGLPLPADADRRSLEAVTLWLARGEASLVARGLRDAGYRSFHVDGRALFPAASAPGILLIEVEVLDGDPAGADADALTGRLRAILAGARNRPPRAAELEPVGALLLARHTSSRATGNRLARELAVECGLRGSSPADVLGSFRRPTEAGCAALIASLGWDRRVEVTWDLR